MTNEANWKKELEHAQIPKQFERTHKQRNSAPQNRKNPHYVLIGVDNNPAVDGSGCACQRPIIVSPSANGAPVDKNYCTPFLMFPGLSLNFLVYVGFNIFCD